MRCDLMEANPKIKKYEEFFNETLGNDLKRTLDARDDIYTQIANYIQLKNAIEHIMSKIEQNGGVVQELKTMVDLGANFYAQARVRDPSRVIVCIGMGFYLEMGLSDALSFIDAKLELLNVRTQNLNQNAAEIKAHMTLVLEGLRELQFLS